MVGLARAVPRCVLAVPAVRARAATCAASPSTRSCTCCSRSGSTSSSAGAACSTSGSSRSTASARTPTHSSTRISSAFTCRRSSPCRSCVAVGALIGLMVGLPSRRLSGDYLAIVTLFFLQLFQTLTTNGDSVRGHNITGGPFGILNVDPFSFFGHTAGRRALRRVRRVVSLCRARVLRGRVRGAAVRQPLADRPRVAVAARGLARSRGDGHARQPAEARRLRHRCRSRGTHRHALRLTDGKRVPARLLLRAADHRLHHGDPRRLRAARRAPCSARSSSARCSRRCATRTSRAPIFFIVLIVGLAARVRGSRAPSPWPRWGSWSSDSSCTPSAGESALVLDRRGARGRAGRLPRQLGRRPGAARPVGRAGHVRRCDRRHPRS